MNISPRTWWGSELEGAIRTEESARHSPLPHPHAPLDTLKTLSSLMRAAGFEPVIEEHLARYYPHRTGRFFGISISSALPRELERVCEVLGKLSHLTTPPPLIGVIIIGAPDTPLGNLHADGSLSPSFSRSFTPSVSFPPGTEPEGCSAPLPPTVALIRDELRHARYLAIDRRESFQLERHLWFSPTPYHLTSPKVGTPRFSKSDSPRPGPTALASSLMLERCIDLPLGSRLSHILKSAPCVPDESLLRISLGATSVRWPTLELTAHHDRLIKKELIVHRYYPPTPAPCTPSWTAENTSREAR